MDTSPSPVPDTSIETELTVKAIEEVDSYQKEYWFKVIEGGRKGFQHGMRVSEDIEIEIGSYYKVTAQSLNDKRTLWKVVSATEVD